MNNSGITNFNVLNTNFLYIQGIAVDFGGSNAYLQGEIDAIEAQLIPISAITSRIDFNTAPALIGNLVITEDNKNSVLLTAIQNINTQIGSLNKLDLSALPALPPGACVITPTTTNQYLNGLITTNTSNISTIQGQITTINNSITAINNKLAHFSTFTYGADTMSGITDGTGFAVATSGTQAGSGLFVYPNASAANEQIMLVTETNRNLLLRGGNQVGIFGGKDSSLANRNLIDIGDKLDRINIGRNHNVGEFPEVNIGVDVGLGGSASTTNIQGDIYYSSFGGVGAVVTQTPLLYGDATPGVKFGNTNNYTLKPVLAGLDVTAVGVIPITLSAVSGLILISALGGGISLTTGIGAITMTTGAGGCSISTGVGAVSVNTGAGVMNFASGSGNIGMSTISGNITLGAGKALGGTAGNVALNAFGDVVIQPDVETDIYKTAFIEFNPNATAPPITASRLYKQGTQLYFDGLPINPTAGNYVLKTGDTMTGTLILPQATLSSNLQLTNLLAPPSPVTNKLYLLNGVLSFNGAPISGGGGGAYVLKVGDTMTGTLVTPQVTTPILASTSGSSSVASMVFQPLAGSYINVDASTANGVPTFQVKNNLATSNFGAVMTLNNNKSGAGTIGDQLGVIKFQGKDSASASAQQYANITAFVNDPASTSKDGRLSTNIAVANTMTEMMRISSSSAGVKRCDIGATYTEIGTNAIGSAATSTLTISGTANATTSLQTPLIYNAANIYPATSTTLVDNAVRKYQPERLYHYTDYPDPLTAPTIDGEKVIILNQTGSPPGGIDKILQASDFPSINSATMIQILQNKYVASTATTPACSYITAAYSDNTASLFVLPDIGATALTLIQICRITQTGNVAYVNDMVVRQRGATNIIYLGGKFDIIQLPVAFGPASVQANNFSGQIVVTWGGTAPSYSIGGVTINLMLSNHTTADAPGSWTGDNGVNNEVTCVIDVTGSSGFPQPSAAYDSIVIGGDFTDVGVGTTPHRPLLRLAYYDYYPADATPVVFFSQPISQYYYSQPSNYLFIASFATSTSGTYAVNAEFKYNYIPQGSAPANAIVHAELIDVNNAVLATSAAFPFNGNQTISVPLTPSVALNGSYSIRIICENFNDFTGTGSSFEYLGDSGGAAYSYITANLAVGVIGWRTLNNTFSAPVGPTSKIRGGGLFSSQYLGFIFDGDTITTYSGTLTSNRIFSVYYSSGTASFVDMGSDSAAIESTQSWGSGHINSISGGNPSLFAGPGNAIAYAELYCNRGFNNSQNVGGVYYRPTSVDPYEMTDCLIFVDNGLTAYQLKPNPTSDSTASVYRDDTKYNNVFWVARATKLQTASLPFSGGVPNYTDVNLVPSASIPCMSFGGYSSEIGYTGLLLICPTAVYLYKGGLAGDLVVELVGCVVRCANNIYAKNKLVFPAAQDGTSITLVGDTTIEPALGVKAWWAISQDGGIYYDSVYVNNNAGQGVTSIIAGGGITASPSTGAVTISNAGVTQLLAGTNISLTGSTGSITISASGGGGGVTSITAGTGIAVSASTGVVDISNTGVLSLAPYTLPSGNATPFLIYPGYLSTGALQGYISPTKLSYYNSFSGNITIGNGLSIFGAAIGVPGGLVGNISPQFVNTSKKYKLTCSVSIIDSTGGGNFNGGNHWGNFSINFINSTIPSVSYGSIWGAQVAPNLGAPIPTQSSGSVFGTSWTDVFVDAVGSPGRYLSLAQTFIIAYNGNYSATSLSGHVFWELEYTPDP